MAQPILNINHLSKAFGSNVVLRDIDFTVNKGDVISIIGASGSGKSTLLRCINLLETPTSGQIIYDGKDVASAKVTHLNTVPMSVWCSSPSTFLTICRCWKTAWWVR